MTAWLIGFGVQEFLGFQWLPLREYHEISWIWSCDQVVWIFCYQWGCLQLRWAIESMTLRTIHRPGWTWNTFVSRKCFKDFQGSTIPPDVFKTKVPSSKLVSTSFTSQDENLTDLWLALAQAVKHVEELRTLSPRRPQPGRDASAMFREVFSGSMTSCSTANPWSKSAH